MSVSLFCHFLSNFFFLEQLDIDSFCFTSHLEDAEIDKGYNEQEDEQQH
jgi:hypothetical protein